MSGGVTELRDFVERRYRPTVLVFSTDGAETVCKKNSLTFIGLLKPFTDLTKDIHTRTTGDAYPLRQFGIRLTDFAGLKSNNDDIRAAWFTKLAKQFLDFGKPADRKKMSQWENSIEYLATQADKSRPGLSPNQMSGIVKELSSPLFQRFKEEYSRSCRFTPFDTFDHPVACILAVSSASPDAIAELKGLYTVHHQDFTAAAVDQQQLVYYVLIQDMSVTQKQSEVDKVFADMKAQFGAQICKLLQLNNNRTGGSESEVDPTKWLHPETMDEQNPSREGVARMLAANDETSLGTMMQSFIEQTLLSQLTRRIKGLHQAVSDKRQGRIGKMMGYWFGKQNDNQTKVTREGPLFVPDSYEMQLRKLGDLCFLLHDYETALGFYKTLKSELGTTPDNRANYQAACHEAIGMCSTLLRHRRDTDAYFDQAAQLYLRGRKSDYALRTRLFQYSLSKINRGHRSPEIIKLASQIEEKRPLYYGMFHEEAGLAYLYGNPGDSTVFSKIRKFAFSLTLAGCKYSSCGCTDQALRANLLAAVIYRNMNLEKWDPINEHIQLTLARLWKHKNDLASAVHHMGLFIVQTKKSKLMSEYNGYLQAYLDSSNVTAFELPLPSVKMNTTNIIVNLHSEIWINKDVSPEQQASAMPSINFSGIENEWDRMDLDFSDAVRTELGTYKPHPQSVTKRQKQNENKVIVANEEVVVEFVIENPLPSKITLDTIKLLYEVTDSQPSPLEIANPPSDISSLLKGTEIESICMLPTSSHDLKLKFSCPRKGWCRIVGFSWTLTTTQSIDSYFLFCNSGVSTENLKDLVLECTDTAPLLQLTFETPPPLMTLDGQLHSTHMNLSNIGGSPMTHVALKLSTANSHFITIEPPEGSTTVYNKDINGLVDFYIFPGEIKSGEVLKLPVIIRSCSGNNSTEIVSNYIPLLVSYADKESGLSRMCRAVVRQVVLPSVSCRVITFPPPGVVHEDNFVMCLEICSRIGRLTDISVNSIQTLSHDWDISLLDADALSDCSSLTVKTSSTYTLTLQATRRSSDERRSGSIWGCDLNNLLTHFVHHSPKDVLRNTGGSGSLADPTMERSGGMSMFVDRKEKKKAAEMRGQPTEKLVRKRFPLSFSIGWKVRDIDGQTILSCEPYETSVKPRGQWQDSLSQTANLLRDRGSPLSADNQTVAVIPILPDGELVAGSPKLSNDQKRGFLGLSLGYMKLVPHDFSKQITCQVPIDITVTNHRHLPVSLWIDLKDVKMTTSVRKDDAPPSTSASNPPPLTRGSVPQPAHPPAQQKSIGVDQHPQVRFPTFYWQGKCKFKVSLQPFATRTVTAHAQFTRAGTYNVYQFGVQIIGKWNDIEIQGIDDEMSLLTISDKSVVVSNEEEDITTTIQESENEITASVEETTRISPVDVVQLEDNDDEGSTDLDVPLSETISTQAASNSNISASPSPPPPQGYSASPSLESKSPVASPAGSTPSPTPEIVSESHQQITTEQVTLTDNTDSSHEVCDVIQKNNQPTDEHHQNEDASQCHQQSDVNPFQQLPGSLPTDVETKAEEGYPNSEEEDERNQEEDIVVREEYSDSINTVPQQSDPFQQMTTDEQLPADEATVSDQQFIEAEQPEAAGQHADEEQSGEQQQQSSDQTTEVEIEQPVEEPQPSEEEPQPSSEEPQSAGEQQQQSSDQTTKVEIEQPVEEQQPSEEDPQPSSGQTAEIEIEQPVEEQQPSEEEQQQPVDVQCEQTEEQTATEGEHQPEVVEQSTVDPFQQSSDAEREDPFQGSEQSWGNPFQQNENPFQQKYSSDMNEVLQDGGEQPASPPVDPFVDNQQVEVNQIITNEEPVDNTTGPVVEDPFLNQSTENPFLKQD